MKIYLKNTSNPFYNISSYILIAPNMRSYKGDQSLLYFITEVIALMERMQNLLSIKNKTIAEQNEVYNCLRQNVILREKNRLRT